MSDFAPLIFGLIFVFGLVIGSFLNVLIYRLPQDMSIFGRSFCPKCRKKISWSDNIPLVSFVLLRGKCRKCHSPIFWQYPIVELLTGFMFVIVIWFFFPVNFQFSIFIIHQNASFAYFQLILSMAYYLLIISTLIIIFFTDLRYGIIPDKITLPAVVISFIFLISQYPNLLVSNFLSGLGAAVFLGFLFLITRGRGMGLGDVKLAFLLGLFLGFPKIIPAFYLAFLTGAGVSIILILAGKKRFGQTISFGPFLVFGTILVFFFHEKILAFFPWLHPDWFK